MRGEAQARRKDPIFDESQIDALGAYVQANGGGPTVERNADGSIEMKSLRGNDLGRGGDLFRLNCASCHNFTGKGGALSSGKFAPDLEPANEQQILAAMRTGPQNMPKFSDRQLSFDAKKDIIAYVKNATDGPAVRAATAWAASAPHPRAWRRGSSEWSPSSARRCGLGHDRERMTEHGPAAGPHRRRTERDVARGTRRTRRPPRRRGDRLQGTALAGRGHQGREARRAFGGRLAFAGRVARAWLCCWCSCSGRGSTSQRARPGNLVYSLATPLYGLTFGGSVLCIADRRGAFPEKVHPRRDFDPGPPLRRGAGPTRSTARR